MNSELQKKLEQLVADTSKSPAHKQIQDVTGSMPIAIGGLYVFDMPVEIPIFWCAVFTHPDNDHLWFAAPVDGLQLHGTKDVEVPEEAPQGPLSIRCAKGIWIHADDFVGAKEFGVLEPIFVEQIRDRLARMRSGSFPDANFLVQADSDPDYTDWMQELSQAVAAFENHLHNAEAEVKSIYQFSANWMADAGIEATLSLAADAQGVGSIPDLEDSDLAPVGATIKKYDGPGTLVAIKYPTEVLFHIFGLDSGQAPPRIEANGVNLEWFNAGSYWATDEIEWMDEKIEFSVDGESYDPIER